MSLGHVALGEAVCAALSSMVSSSQAPKPLRARQKATSPSIHVLHRLARGDREGRDDIRRDEQQETERSSSAAVRVRRDPTPRQRLLARDERRDERHPDDAHDAQREERGHERPAAARRTTPPCRTPMRSEPRAAVAPRAEQEPERAAALRRQTSLSGVSS
jgi:hypothetical protein